MTECDVISYVKIGKLGVIGPRCRHPGKIESSDLMSNDNRGEKQQSKSHDVHQKQRDQSINKDTCVKSGLILDERH